MKLVKDYMSTNLICCSPDESIFDAARKMADYDISGLPVIEGDKVVGIISITDIVKYITSELNKTILDKLDKLNINNTTAFLIVKLIEKEIRFVKEMRKISKSKVKDVMTKKVVTISPDAPILEAAHLMEKKDISRLPVVDKNGKLVGIITKVDLLRALLEI